MAKRVVDESSLTSVADAIRSKKGTTAPLVFPEGFNSAIASIEADPKLHSKAVTPSAENQTVFPDADYDGLSHVTVAGDPDLVSGNIKEGVNIFGVTGTHTGIGGTVADTSDATATEDDIEKGKTAYVNGKKITGKHECEEGLDTSDATATENDLLKGATAYVNGEKITGMHECDVFTPSGTKVITTNGTHDVAKYEYAEVKVDDSGITLPALTSPGSANDLAEGVELIGENGEIIKGSLPVVAEGSSVASAANYATMQYTGNLIYARGPYNPLNLPGLDRIVRSGAELVVPLLASAFGNASPADVAAGKTFTSQNGLKVVGTHECSGGIKLPEIDASVLGTASDLASGKQLIDADGNVVTGNVSTPNYFTKTNLPVTYDENITSIELRTKTEEDMLLRAGKSISLWARASNFGDATAADVAAGKTFTSAAGHKVVGTMDVDALINNALEVIENGTY